MTEYRISKIIGDARAELAPLFAEVDDTFGDDAGDPFRAGFNVAADRLRQGQITPEEFAALMGELRRDASGPLWTNAADGPEVVDENGANGPETRGRFRRMLSDVRRAFTPGVRQAWTSMPNDGSAHLTTIERVLFLVTAVACVLVLAWVADLGARYTFERPALRAAATVTGPDTAAQHRSAARDRDLIMRGGYMSWEVINGCEQGPEECRAAMRDANNSGKRYGVRVAEDGTLLPGGGPDAVTVDLSQLHGRGCWWEVKSDGSTEQLCK